MATPNAVRSLRTLFVALLVISLATACKQSGSGSDVDPRDQYVGVYVGGEKSYQSVISFGSADLNPEVGVVTITVTKGAKSKEMYVDISNRPMKVTVELNGSDFTVIDRTRDQIFVQGTTFEGTYSATGVFGKDQASGKEAIVINAVTEALRTGTTVRRTETIVGNRK